MAKTVSLYEAKTHLSALVEEAAAGGEVVIAKNGKPKARLVPIEEKKPKKVELGFWAGQGWAADDIDAPLPDDIIDEMLHGDDELFDLRPPKDADDPAGR